MTDDPILAELTRSDPESTPASDPPRRDDAELLRRILASDPEVPATRAASRRRARVLIPSAVSLAVVAAVVAIALDTGGPAVRPAAPAAAGTTVVLRARPTAAHPQVTRGLMGAEVSALRRRAAELGTTRGTIRVTATGRDTIAVTIGAQIDDPHRAVALLTASPSLAFTDWEANVIAPDGRPSVDHPRSAAALTLSQGLDGGLPGSPHAGGLTLRAAVRRAAAQPARTTGPGLTRLGPQHFRFSADGRFLAVSDDRMAPRPGTVVLTVPEGTLVVGAQTIADQAPDYADPSSRYFVLRDDAALTGATITRAVSRGPAVDLTLTGSGSRAFTRLTRTIARRGADAEVASSRRYQHFAIVANGSLLTVGMVDYNVYPDGILPTGPSAAQREVKLQGGMSAATADRLAGALSNQLPLGLRVVGTPG